MAERAIAAVPAPMMVVLAAAFCAQLAFKGMETRPAARAADLPGAPSVGIIRLLDLGEPIGTAQLLSLYLQAFDTQPGISFPFRDLDYAGVQNWLDRISNSTPMASIRCSWRPRSIHRFRTRPASA